MYHIVNADGIVLARFGAALREMAIAKCDSLGPFARVAWSLADCPVGTPIQRESPMP